MKTRELEHLFPTRDDIPAQHRLDPLAAGAYLIDGELRQWTGPWRTHTARSSYGPKQTWSGR